MICLHETVVAVLAGKAPVCNPKRYFECVIKSMEDYVSNNKAAMCNCPRQCRHLSYSQDISQAMMSDNLAKFGMNYMRGRGHTNATIDGFRNDHCMLEVVGYAYVSFPIMNII